MLFVNTLHACILNTYKYMQTIFLIYNMSLLWRTSTAKIFTQHVIICYYLFFPWIWFKFFLKTSTNKVVKNQVHVQLDFVRKLNKYYWLFGYMDYTSKQIVAYKNKIVIRNSKTVSNVLGFHFSYDDKSDIDIFCGEKQILA